MFKLKLMGIVNVTPDSFSDGGVHFAPQAALAAIKTLAAEGAAIVDVGAESTRPGATPISAQEELARLAPILAALPALDVPVSIDTRHPETARAALAAGAAWINDVSGLLNPAMIEAVRGAECKLVLMHSLSVPADKTIILPPEADPVALVLEWAEERLAALEKQGIARERVVFDPGIGFGKTAAQSWALVRGVVRFSALGVPLLVGHSRKSFLAEGAAQNRDDATLETSRFLASQGVEYLRVHDVHRHFRELM